MSKRRNYRKEEAEMRNVVKHSHAITLYMGQSKKSKTVPNVPIRNN
ncbi:22762_t:CDS:2 [Rhizophagus irregularis]|nr:22762_t:CDS:2 [Rhizophagus irregularis]